jgi:acyl-coenzyme A thioesterase PaaI-like protein
MNRPVATAEPQHSLRVIQPDAHPFCFVCSASNPMGLALDCVPDPDGGVRAGFLAHAAMEGYPGVLHGGLVASLLDGAMTQCLFAQGVVAMTAELTIRYHHEVSTAESLTVRAWLESEAHGRYLVAAEIQQGGRITTRAKAKFLERRAAPPPQ